MDWHIWNLVVSVCLLAMGAVIFVIGFHFGVMWERRYGLRD